MSLTFAPQARGRRASFTRSPPRSTRTDESRCEVMAATAELSRLGSGDVRPKPSLFGTGYLSIAFTVHRSPRIEHEARWFDGAVK